MKRLLTYLFIVLGLGLTFSVNSNGKEINKEFYKFKKILVPLSKDGSWKLIGKKTQNIYSAKLTWIYLAQTKDNQLSKLIELVHMSAAAESVTESISWFKNFVYQNNGYKSCIPKNTNAQPSTLRENYYVYEESEKSKGCFFTRNMDIEEEILHPTIKRKTTYKDTNHFSAIVKKYINNKSKFPKIMLRSDHYFISQQELYGYFEMINPDVNGAPNTLFKSEKKSEYHPLNIDNHPQKKNFYLTWIKNQAKKHLKFETELKRKNKINLAKYIGDSVIKDFDPNNITALIDKSMQESVEVIKKKEADKTLNLTNDQPSFDLAKNQETINNNEIKVDVKICVRRIPTSKTTRPNVNIVKKSKPCPGLSFYFNIVKYKDIPKNYMLVLQKRNICYNENKSRIKIRSGNCKEEEFYLKYKELNNEDIFYYETEKTQIAKTEPTITPKKKVKVAKVEEPKQEEFKPKKTTQDNEAPVIKIAEAITVNDTSYILEGSVTDKADKIFLEIDGQPVEVKKGKFKVKRYSPVNEQIKIVAIDQWGNKSKTKLVNITIDIENTIVAKKFEPLNPSNISNKSSDNKVALVIGIENYSEAPKANYANLDAKYFFDYARRAFGVQKQNINLLINEEATVVKTDKAVSLWLKSKIKKNESDLIIFFAGHGLASSDGKELYLLPQDGNPDRLERTALSRTDLFKEIISLNPKSVTMFLDTCYSGVSRDEQMLLASARPIRIVADEQDSIPNNFTIFSASQLDQISSGLKEANHGIFSYYLMKGLEGKADSNNDKKITNGELLAYMDENVSQKAAEQGREQNPSLAGDPDKILMSYR
tara:strand:- start:1437 stop:3899 length:2463 start_codon:yes stop_codon:yes gene_type:complete